MKMLLYQQGGEPPALAAARGSVETDETKPRFDFRHLVTQAAGAPARVRPFSAAGRLPRRARLAWPG